MNKKHKFMACSTPRVQKSANVMYDNTAYSVTQLNRLSRFYGVDMTTSRIVFATGKPANNIQALEDAGALQGVHRSVLHDGARIMAALVNAGVLEDGVDPVASVLALLADAGCNVDHEDCAWANSAVNGEDYDPSEDSAEDGD